MKKLLFKNPVLVASAMNTTVRLGDKWYNDTHPGDVLDVVETGNEDNVLATAVVRDVEYYKNFRDIPINVLRLEHDPDCRSYSGLVGAMLRAYGTNFTDTSPVTVVYFEVRYEDIRSR